MKKLWPIYWKIMKFDYSWKMATDYPKKNGLKVFSTFACGGGSTMGYKLAGFTVVGANDIDPKMKQVYQKNHKPALFILGPISALLKTNLPAELYDLDILDGSPPCSTFSMAGSREKAWKKNKKFREGQSEQVLSDLFFEWIKLVDKLKPKVAVAENVAGLLQGNAKAYTAAIVSQLKAIGYDVQIFLLDASKMGVPQKRRRVFFICRRIDLNLQPIKLEFKERPVMFGEYRDDQGSDAGVSELRKKLLSHRVQSDKSLASINKRLFNKVSSFNAQIIKDTEVCPTITATEINYRFSDGLAMTTKDLALTGSFPLDYDYLGVKPKYLIGMSVPPVMMARIAHEIHKQIFNEIYT